MQVTQVFANALVAGRTGTTEDKSGIRVLQWISVLLLILALVKKSKSKSKIRPGLQLDNQGWFSSSNARSSGAATRVQKQTLTAMIPLLLLPLQQQHLLQLDQLPQPLQQWHLVHSQWSQPKLAPMQLEAEHQLLLYLLLLLGLWLQQQHHQQ
jgi:hypothetical protein